MGQMKKLKEVINSFDRLPNGSFKDSVMEDIEQIKELYAEVHSLQKMKDMLEGEKDVNTNKNG